MMSLTFGDRREASGGGDSTSIARRRTSSFMTSRGWTPDAISRGVSNGSLNRRGELHLNALNDTTIRAVFAVMYLKKLTRS